MTGSRFGFIADFTSVKNPALVLVCEDFMSHQTRRRARQLSDGWRPDVAAWPAGEISS
jgi:hypothetical protein